MLRCLGWEQIQTILLIIIKSTLFYAIPGALIGTFLGMRMVTLTQDGISMYAGKPIELEVTFEAMLIGFGAAVFLTFVSMVKPVFNCYSIPLRDALDVFRSKVETMTVSFKKFEDMLGLSLNQMIMGLMLSGFGVSIYVIVPYSLLFG